MSLSGPEALRALDEALRDIRVEEGEIVRKLGRTAERIAKIRASEAELLQIFARGRVAPEREALFQAGAVQAAARARAPRPAELTEGAKRLAEIDREIVGLCGERHGALTAVDRQQAALRDLAPRIAAAVARDPAYELQQQHIARLKTIAVAARAKARQADLDREEKGRPYRTDPLFAYLAARGYGTAAYRERSALSRVDDWVARLINFAAAEKHYRMLDALPQLLHVHADQQAAAVATADGEIDAIERSAIDTAGGAAIRAALTETLGRIAAIDQRIGALQDARDPLTLGQAALAEMTDPAFEAAKRELAAALGRADIPAVISAIRAAGGSADAALLTQLGDVRLRVVEEATDARDDYIRLKTLAERRRSLEDIEYEFKANKLDDPRTVFRDETLTGTLLTNFLSGKLDAQAYWRTFLRDHGWSEGTTEWGGGVGLPRHGRPADAAEPEISRLRSGIATDAA